MWCWDRCVYRYHTNSIQSDVNSLTECDTPITFGPRGKCAEKSFIYLSITTCIHVGSQFNAIPSPYLGLALIAILQSHATGEIDMPQMGKCFTPRQLANEKLCLMPGGWLSKYTGAAVGFMWVGYCSQPIDLAIY